MSIMLRTVWGVESGLKVYHLQVYQTSEAQIFSLSPTTAAVKDFIQSHLSHFFSRIKGSKPSPSSCLHAERRLLSSGGAGGSEVMSSLPLGGISLIKMK